MGCLREKKRRGIAAPRWPFAWGLPAPRLLERRDGVAGLVLGREKHDLLARLLELVGVLVHDSAELRLHDDRDRPLAVGPEPDRADDGLELVLAQVGRQRLVVEALGGGDRLLEHLADRVVE